MGNKSGDEKKRKTGKLQKVQVLGFSLLAAALLTGCTARELESRSFPLALEIGVSQGQLLWACAWPSEGTNGGGGENDSQKEGSGEEESSGEEGSEEESSGEKGSEEEGSERESGGENSREVGSGQEEVSTKGMRKGEKINKEWQVNNEEITRVAAPSVEEAVRAIQNLQDRYVDYSQVKAILWDRSLKEDPQMEQQVLGWLEENPVFARNILIFDVERADLNLEMVQQQAQGQPGAYLENLYKNNDRCREQTRTLEEVLYFKE